MCSNTLSADEHKKYVEKHGIDMPKVLHWKWGTHLHATTK